MLLRTARLLLQMAREEAGTGKMAAGVGGIPGKGGGRFRVGQEGRILAANAHTRASHTRPFSASFLTWVYTSYIGR